jgi:hypothetical protein
MILQTKEELKKKRDGRDKTCRSSIPWKEVAVKYQEI